MKFNYQLLVLDYGGVYSFEYNPAAQDTIMQKSFGKVPSTEEYEVIHPLSSLLAANSIDSTKYVQDVATILKVQPPEPIVFEDATISVTYDPSPAMIEFVKELRLSGLTVSLLSDMFMFEAVKTRPWGRYDGFDYVSLSAEIGAAKHEKAAFLHTLTHFDIAAEDVLFVDDKKSNIDTAASVGMNYIWANKEKYPTAESLIADIKKALGYT